MLNSKHHRWSGNITHYEVLEDPLLQFSNFKILPNNIDGSGSVCCPLNIILYPCLLKLIAGVSLLHWIPNQSMKQLKLFPDFLQ